ncbi:MAG: hypothetical protein FJX77_07650 [Armatimonadetes bacterium]|nr:hypothetical protein [Armatimonadota bacterium]
MSTRVFARFRRPPPRLLAAGYGALFGLAAATMAGTVAGAILFPTDWIGWAPSDGTTEGILPGLAGGALVGLFTATFGTLRRMWIGELMGWVVGGGVGAAYGLRTDPTTVGWVGPGSFGLHCSAIGAATCGFAFAWVAALAGALVAPGLPLTEALPPPGEPRFRTRWSAPRRDLAVFGVARAALVGCPFWMVVLLLFGWLEANSLEWWLCLLGLWIGCGPHALLGLLLLRRPGQGRIAPEPLLGGLYSGLETAGLLCLSYLPDGLEELMVFWETIVLLAGVGMGIGLLIGADLVRVRARLAAGARGGACRPGN